MPQPHEPFFLRKARKEAKSGKGIRNKKLKIRNKEMKLLLFEIPNPQPFEPIEPFEHQPPKPLKHQKPPKPSKPFDFPTIPYICHLNKSFCNNLFHISVY